MVGRDPHEPGRVATPLELLFDLTFVVAFSIGSAEFAHEFAEGRYVDALIGFGFATFAIWWAWINFAWFASAYDTDDWVFRLVTMAQMIGVLVLAVGLPRMFASIEHGAHLDNSVMVLGYVVMRVAMIFQWLRASREDPARRRACLTYATAIAIAQIGWVAQIFLDLPLGTTFVLTCILTLIEVSGPVIAERRDGGTPWHAHHIAERYGLLAIIALGEGVVGTLATITAVVGAEGWTLDAALVGIAGTGLTFGMWWIYYMLPSATVLHAHRERSFVWGYGHLFVIAAIVATGAGLHVAALMIEHQGHIGALPTLLSVAVPVGSFILSIYLLYWYLIRRFDLLHLVLMLATLAVIAVAVLAAAGGIDMAWCLVIVMLAPVVTIIGYEAFGHRYQAAALASEHGAR